MRLTMCIFVALTQSFAQHSGANGVYGGYVGSARWFDSMRQSAANAVMLRAIGGSSTRPAVPVDYSEVAGVFTFTSGNPFPGGRLPDLRIAAVDRTVDGIERAPFITGQPPSFYTILKRGQQYRFSWMYYFGGKEVFANYAVPLGAAHQLRLVISVDSKGHGRVRSE